MTYIKNRLQRFSHSINELVLIDVASGKVVGKRKEKYPYVRVLRVHKGKING